MAGFVPFDELEKELERRGVTDISARYHSGMIVVERAHEKHLIIDVYDMLLRLVILPDMTSDSDRIWHAIIGA